MLHNDVHSGCIQSLKIWKSLYLLVVASAVFRPDDSNNTGIIAAISTLC